MPLLIQGKTNWKYILIVLILGVIIAGGILDYLKYFKKEIISITHLPEIKKPEKFIEEGTANWKTYRNEEYEFEIKYPRDYKISDFLRGIRIDGPHDLTIFFDVFSPGLNCMGNIIVEEEQKSLKDYLNYFYRVCDYENPSSGAYKDPEYKEIMNTDYFTNIPSLYPNVDIWRQRLTPNLGGFESVAYLMDKSRRNVIVSFSWGIESENCDQNCIKILFKQFEQMLSTFRFLE